MNRIISFFRGTVRVQVTGVEPQRCINYFLQQGVTHWGLEVQDDYCWHCMLFSSQLEAARRCARRGMCELKVLQQYGFRQQFSGLAHRPALWLAVLLAITGILILPNYIWTLEVEGNIHIPEQQILQELEQIGIHTGTWIPGLPHTRLLRYKMQLRIPELRWIAVNCSGGKATVLVSERMPQQDTVSKKQVTNLVAARDGVIIDMSILNGFAMCQPGQAVREGQLLVSGLMDHPLKTQATRSLGEIYALTQHEISTVVPAEVQSKQQTGDTARCIYLNFGRKRIKIFGSSGISVSNCDKIVCEKMLTLPGGYTLPLGFTVQTYRYYDAVIAHLPAQEAQAQLETATRRRVLAQMVAGQIQNTRQELTQQPQRYILDTTAWCREMIARPEDASLWNTREDNHGTDH